jgi:FKBP-type peptidyl-prolyl cis-trans isomerase FkpA
MTPGGHIRRHLSLALLVAGVLTAAGCVEATTPSRTPPYSQADIRLGSGAEATAASEVTVEYTGWFHDPLRLDSKGAVFDSSLGRAPFTFRLGTGSVIQGWERGVPGMKEGGVRRLVVPPSLAYGPPRNGPLPPYATLVFDIELVSVTPQTQSGR